MIILDKPYVSEFLKKTIKRLQIPVVRTKEAVQLFGSENPQYVTEAEAIQMLKNGSEILPYTNSENAVNWIEQHIPDSELNQKIKLFKNKVSLRDLLKDLYPDYFYTEISFLKLQEMNVPKLKYPLIIKPAVGFFSIGVQRAENEKELKTAVQSIVRDVKEFHMVYPDEVLNTDNFIIEEYIEGEEFALDLYYDENGKPVILNIMKHLFVSDNDVGDRVYITSKEIIETYKEKLYSFLEETGKRAGLKRFPVHAELRIDSKADIIPVEINPLRFGAWCTTADFAGIALKTNTYENYWTQKEPDWERVFKGKEEAVFSMIVLDNTTGYPAEEIAFFDHEKLKSRLKTIHEYRETDHQTYKVFGFLFAETEKENTEELYHLLHSDLKEYIHLK